MLCESQIRCGKHAYEACHALKSVRVAALSKSASLSARDVRLSMS